MLTPDQQELIQIQLTNEARKAEKRNQVQKLLGKVSVLSSQAALASTQINDANLELAAARDELAALEAGAGPGITDDFGYKSSVTQILESERAAAKSATVDFVKANPTCTEAEANAAWDDAALDSHPDFEYVLQPGAIFAALYRKNLLQLTLIDTDTWEDQRDWMVATAKEVIMSL